MGSDGIYQEKSGKVKGSVHMENPVVSVIVPVYKTEKYLERCVESLRSQSLKNIEIILVDDGSPDRCPSMCDSFAERDERVRVIHKKNAGVSAARNAGLDAAKGRYVTFADSDDYIEPEMYASMLQKAEEYDCDLVMCDCVKDFPEGSEIYTHNIRAGYYSLEQLKGEYYPQLLVTENVEYPATISNWLCLFKNGGDLPRYPLGVRYSEDWLFGALLMKRAESFYYMKGRAFYHYKMNAQSATHTFVPDKWRDYMTLYQNFCDEFLNSELFDFKHQLDLVLLFLVYNAAGGLLGAKGLSAGERKRAVSGILCEPKVRRMFSRLKINELAVSKKQKIITAVYKYRIGISLLCFYFGR